MEKQLNNKLTIPRYQQIAIEIATRIAHEEYRVGEIIYARSSIASQYGVSSETARRAICVLCDLDIVSSTKGSGVTIKSSQKAAAYIKQYGGRQTIDTIKERIMESVERQQQESERLNGCLLDLISASEHFRSMNPFMPFEVRITAQCACLNKTISDLQFWQHTGATVLAVGRQDDVFRSPGPYISLVENDILYFLPQDDTAQRVKDFLYPPPKE